MIKGTRDRMNTGGIMMMIDGMGISTSTLRQMALIHSLHSE